MARRLIPRVAIVVGAIFGFSLFVAILPAHAAACTTVDLGIIKTVSPATGVAPGDPLVHTIRVSYKSTTALSCGPVAITVTDFFTPNQTFTTSSPASWTCTPVGGLIQCTKTIPDPNVAPTVTTETIALNFTTDAMDPGPWCDNATITTVSAIDDNPSNNNTGAPSCAMEESASTPPPDGGGGGTGGGGDDFGFGGGFGNFGGGGFSAATTPIGGVDTGAGGTSRSSAAVPQVALGSLLGLGLGLAVLRRLRRRAA